MDAERGDGTQAVEMTEEVPPEVQNSTFSVLHSSSSAEFVITGYHDPRQCHPVMCPFPV